MAIGITTIVHAFTAFLVLIEIGITGYLVSKTEDTIWWGGNHHAPSQFAFMLFCSIWSVVALLYLALTPIVLTFLYHTIAALAIAGLTTLFWFAGSIAMADFIGVPKCQGNHFCQTAQAGVAFGFFIWACFTGLTVVGVLGHMRGGSRKPGQVGV